MMYNKESFAICIGIGCSCIAIYTDSILLGFSLYFILAPWVIFRV
jgi:hypothetical protein